MHYKEMPWREAKSVCKSYYIYESDADTSFEDTVFASRSTEIMLTLESTLANKS